MNKPLTATKLPTIGSITKDGWGNVLSGIGTTLDRNVSGVAFTNATPMQQILLEQIMRGDDMAARCVEAIPDEMTREWITLRVDEDNQDDSEAIMARLDELNIRELANKSLKDARAYGGAAWLVGADDGTMDLSEPLDEENIRSLDWVNALTPRELVAETYYSDPTAPKYGKPQTYRLRRTIIDPGLVILNRNGGNFNSDDLLVHESRIIRFEGVPIPSWQARQLNGWGDSILTRVLSVIQAFQLAWSSAAILLQDFQYSVYKIKGLTDIFAQEQTAVLTSRIQAVEATRSMLRATVIDADMEEFTRETSSLAGFPEMLDKFALRLAAAVNIPVTLLMGQSPAGLNATGDSDVRFFYDKVSAMQRQHLLPPLNRFLKLLFKAKVDGPTNGKEPKDWHVHFRPLWQLTEVEQADLRNKQAMTDQIYITTQVLNPEEVAQSRFGGVSYSTETKLDLKLREELANLPALPDDGTPGTPQIAGRPPQRALNAGNSARPPSAT